MKTVQIVHNPTAGNALHNKKDLVEFFQGSGHTVKYVSTDWENWEDLIDLAADFILVAGGDGTVHKMAAVLLNSKNKQKDYPPIRLLALGTANNIAETLLFPGSYSLQPGIGGKASQRFDCGRINGLDHKEIFLESVGFGVFPALISEMDKNPIEIVKTEEKLRQILKVLLKVVKDFKAQKAKVQADGINIKGSFLMLEVMNIRSVGPNLELAPDADPGDGYFDLVMVPESRRSQLEDHLEKMIKGEHNSRKVFEFAKIIRVQKVKVKWHGEHMHVDDTFVGDYSRNSVELDMIPSAMEFLESIPWSDSEE